ncbi:Unknown protein [Striga hermonthica]|uniref:Uncharacterized protein n=1 Tax=Striga hermonthica TaxID=68872 RepID=A0A9N7NV34_STRHE|nr:Unknown protein [Striga hermonthica]
MAHFAPIRPHTPKPSISTHSSKTTYLPSPRLLKVLACSNVSYKEKHVQRRCLALVMASAAVALSSGGGNAVAAARRPPPPPPEEKKDPNLTGLTAKVLASKKRKEAMKDSIAKLRDKGKLIQEPSQ